MNSVVSQVPLENWPFILINYNLKSQLWPVVPTEDKAAWNRAGNRALGLREARGYDVKMGTRAVCPKCGLPTPGCHIVQLNS